ncbi:hypothetical protein F5B20DRAFT_200116 [Whalleya microplaca]|nr:hypothetical protein F5B20DRAFT_200116 [Whalleya microplaca]
MVHASSKRYRPRSGLYKFGPSAGNNSVTLRKLFRHRYFSRLWVIQELLLSASILVPLYDKDFLADTTFSRRVRISWGKTKAPWFEHIASRRAFPRDQILTILRQTWISKATDPRDKVFGILGLIDANTPTDDLIPDSLSDLETIDYSLVPNYSLSVLETFIGITAYVMITLGHWKILENAAGVNTIPGYPTWMPDYRDSLMWHNRSPAEDVLRLDGWYIGQRLCCLQAWNLSSSKEVMRTCWRWRNSEVERTLRSWALPKKQYHLTDIYYTQVQRLRAIMRDGDSVHDGLSINPSTAALSIKLVRILHVTSSPVLVYEDLRSFLRVFEFTKASYRILVCTGLIALDELLSTGSIWLYLREIGDTGSTFSENAGSTLFFLREAQQGQQSDTYDLVCCCVCWDLVIYPEPEESKERRSSEPSTKRPCGLGFINKFNHPSHNHALGSGSSWAYPLLYEPLHAAISMFLECYDLDSKLEFDIRRIFPSEDTRVRSILPVLQYLLDELDSVGPNNDSFSALDYHHFGRLYLSTLRQISTKASPSLDSPCEDHWVCPLLEEDLDRGCVFFTFEPPEWAEVSEYYELNDVNTEDWRDIAKIWVNLSMVPTEHSDNKHEQPQQSDQHGWLGWRKMIIRTGHNPEGLCVDKTQTVCICMDLKYVAELLADTELFSLLRNLTRFRPLTGEDEVTMAQGMKDDYRGIYRHNWPESLAAELQLDGKPYRVQLV